MSFLTTLWNIIRAVEKVSEPLDLIIGWASKSLCRINWHFSRVERILGSLSNSFSHYAVECLDNWDFIFPSMIATCPGLEAAQQPKIMVLPTVLHLYFHIGMWCLFYAICKNSTIVTSSARLKIGSDKVTMPGGA